MNINQAALLFLFVPILPLVGPFINRGATYVLMGVAWAALLGAFLLDIKDTLKMIIGIQVPLMILITIVSTRILNDNETSQKEDSSNQVQKMFKELTAQHKQLKTAVTKSNTEERQTLQVYATAKGLAEALSWKDMAPRLTSGIQKIFGGMEFLLFAYDENGNRTRLERRGGWSKDFPLDQDKFDHTKIVPSTESSEVVPLLAIPIHSGQGDNRHRNGLLILKASSKERTDEELISIGSEFGEQLGMALDKALLFSQMEEHSRVDGLTGVLRRQAFMDRYHEELKRATTFHTTMSVMMVDIDHFKAVNDSHGHDAGDEVLRRVGDALKNTVYETDVVGRYGGEEFIILFPRAQKEGVMRKAEMIRQQIQDTEISVGFDKLSVTVSIGVAHYPDSATDGEALIARADAVLYEAKEGGRNRVIEG